MKQVSIYALVDPRDGKIKYIGKTASKLKDRLNSHIRESRKKVNGSKKINWINHLLKKDLKPSITLLEVCTDNDHANLREIALIMEHRQAGFDLKNTRAGGEGSPPGTPIKSRYQSPKGVLPPQLAINIKTLNVGRIHSQEHKDNLSKMRKGKPVPSRCVPVEVVNLLTKERTEFASAKLASEFLEVPEHTVFNSCKKKNTVLKSEYTVVYKGNEITGISSCYKQPIIGVDTDGTEKEFKSIQEAAKYFEIPREVMSFLVKLEMKDKYGRSWKYKIKQ